MLFAKVLIYLLGCVVDASKSTPESSAVTPDTVNIRKKRLILVFISNFEFNRLARNEKFN